MKQKKIVQIVGLATSILLALPLAAQQTNTSTGQQPSERQREPNRMLQNNQQQDRADKWDKSGDKMHSKKDKNANAHVRASDLVGIDIVGADNNKIGEIDEVFVDLESGEVLGAVISAGGTLGFGDEQYVIHLDDLEYNAEEEHMRISLTSNDLKNAPRYREGDTRVFETLRSNRIRSGDTTSAL